MGEELVVASCGTTLMPTKISANLATNCLRWNAAPQQDSTHGDALGNLVRFDLVIEWVIDDRFDEPSTSLVHCLLHLSHNYGFLLSLLGCVAVARFVCLHFSGVLDVSLMSFTHRGRLPDNHIGI